jgi:hypothetical protein
MIHSENTLCDWPTTALGDASPLIMSQRRYMQITELFLNSIILLLVLCRMYRRKHFWEPPRENSALFQEHILEEKPRIH